jgi:hypothetical protein
MEKKISSSESKEIVDYQTGEIISSVKTKIFSIDKEPEYIKLYIRDIGRLNSLAPGMDRVLYEVVRSMGYSNVVVAYKPIKKIMCANLDITMNYLNKCIDNFYKKGILIRIDRGVYVADPLLFGKGRWSDIKNLRLVIEYDEKGKRTLKSNLPEEMQLRLGL